MKSKFRKLIAVLLATIMLIGVLPAYAIQTTNGQISINDIEFIGFEEWQASTGGMIGLSADLTPNYIGPTGGKFISDTKTPVAAGSIPISDRAGLEAIANNLSGTYHLTDDIDLSGADWVPIGGNSDFTNWFTGTFDGQGYIIRNMKITGAGYDHNGLFGFARDATIKNIGLEGTYIDIRVTITSSAYITIGGICGYISSTSVINCYNMGSIAVSSASSSVRVGGINGINFDSIINNCYNTGNISDSTSDTGIFGILSVDSGGISGSNFSGSINDCYNTGNISSAYGYGNAGGISGSSSVDTINNCYNTGNISVSNSGNAGGIIGNSTLSVINNCHNRGDISAFSPLGSYVFSGRTGGIIGYGGSTINDCYNLGIVSVSGHGSFGSSYAGGIIGDNVHSGIINNCYNMGNISVVASVTGSVLNVYSGGIIGSGSSPINNCYNMGNISASSTTAALSHTDSSAAYAGGIYGSSGNTTINNCYNTGEVNSFFNRGYAYIGGITGMSRFNDTIITSSYCPDLYGSEWGTQLTSAQMRNAVNFVGWDFANVWDISPSVNGGYPFLRSLTGSGSGGSDDLCNDCGKYPCECEFKKDGVFKYKSGVSPKEYVTAPIVPFYYEDNYFNKSSTLYNHDLAKMSLALALTTYDYYELKRVLEEIEFTNIEPNNYYIRSNTDQQQTRSDNVGFAIAHKNIDDYTVVTVVIRGFDYGAEWAGNFNLGLDHNYHEGFAEVRDIVINDLVLYLHNNQTNIKNNIKIWLTGYSRAGAVANLIAGNLHNNPDVLKSYYPIPNSNNKININENISFDTTDIYAYCFAPPAGVKGHVNNPGMRYRGIFNIINPNDVVTKVAPVGWGFYRYGIDIYLPSPESIKNYNTLFDKMKGFYQEYRYAFPEDVYLIGDFGQWLSLYHPPIIIQEWERIPQSVYLDGLFRKVTNSLTTGQYNENIEQIIMTSLLLERFTRNDALNLLKVISNITLLDFIFNDIGILNSGNNLEALMSGHYPDLYLAWMYALDGDTINRYAYGDYRIVYINCPVDIEVYDSDNTLVAAIYDDVPQEIENSSIWTGLDADGQKVIYLPIDEEYSINITATANGIMTYSVNEYSRSAGKVVRAVNYYDIPLTKGDVFTAIVKNLFLTETAEYVIEKDGIPIVPTNDMLDDEIKEYTIIATTKGPGVVWGEGSRVNGTFAKLIAMPDENAEFAGWYKENNLISEEIMYRFRVESNITLEARFVPIPYDNDNANLFDLFIDEGTLTPEFNSDIIKYSAVVSYDIESITITAIPVDEVATVSDDVGKQNLIVGENTFEIIVTAQDGKTTKTYTIIIIREAPHVHKYKAVVTDPTCTEKGYTTYICKCGYNYDGDYVAALGHSFTIPVEHKGATCLEKGYEIFKCSRCAETNKRIIPATGHIYSKTVTEPTCTERGYTIFVCDCGDNYIGEHTNALGHDWDRGIITTPATTETEGEKIFTCGRCRETRTETIPKLPVNPGKLDAEFLQEIAADVIRYGLTNNQLRLDGEVLKLIIDEREFVLATNVNNRNVSGKIELPDGSGILIFDIKGNGSNVRVFEISKP